MYQLNVDSSLHNAVSESAYRQLVKETRDATLFTDWPWLNTTVRFCGTERRMFVTCHYQDSLVAFIGLRVAKESLHGIPARVCRFIQYPWGDRIAILLHPEHRAAWPLLLEKLHELSRDCWDCMIWNEWFDEQGLRAEAAAFAARSRWNYYQRLTSRCPVYLLEGKSEAEIVAGYSSKLRSDLKRRKKKLDKLGGKVEHLRPDAEQADALVTKMKYTEQQSWKGDEGVGIFNDPEGADFFREVSRALAENDQLDLSLIWIDDELASYKYGFYFRGTFLDYSIGYLPQYGKIGLGRVLLDELVLAAAREGYRAVDASRVGAVSRHLLFERTDNVVEHYRAYWFSAGPKGKLLWLMVVYLKPMMKRLREGYREWRRQRGARQTKAER